MTPSDPRDFFFHLATPCGEGGLAVFELFGDGVQGAIERLFRGRELPACDHSRLGDLVADSGESIDEVVVTRLSASAMWCGLPAWTLSTHGGVWIQQRVATLLAEAGGVRLDRQQVLERSVAAGALDSIQAAAIELLLEAHTERAAVFFLRQQDGELSDALGECLRLLEAEGEGARERVRRRLQELLAASARAYRLGHPLRILLAGRPNSGKSTLFNRLVERERVAVSAELGTTRDLSRELIALDGFPVELIDSAGLRQGATDEVEEEAIDRVWRQPADLVVYLVGRNREFGDAERAQLARLRAGERLVVMNFSDVAGAAAAFERLRDSGGPERRGPPAHPEYLVSGLRGDGVEDLKAAIVRRSLHGGDDSCRDRTAPFTTRQTELLREALAVAGRPSSLDGLREALIECVRNSWRRSPRH